MSKKKSFLDDSFLLQGETAERLYHLIAASCPIIDYHNHLSPKDIAENRKFENLTSLWLEGDHYKWRAMRIHGVDERFCTGDASPREKFKAWAGTVPYTMRNPLYHWTHLELKRYFDLDVLLSNQTADHIYDACNERLLQNDFSTQSLLSKMKVEVVCTTDDPVDDLRYHQEFAKQSAPFRMYPTFRPDKAYATANPAAYNQYLDQLASVASVNIQSLTDLLTALKKRIAFFDSLDCRAADHGVEKMYSGEELLAKAEPIFRRIRGGQDANLEDRLTLQGAVMLELSKMYHERNWVQQFHIGAQRNNRSKALRELGPDTGFDSIGDFSQAQHLAGYLDQLDRAGQLTRTILYNLNPSDNEVFATMAGNFCDGSVAGKVQWGAAWWFLDQKDGIEKQLNTLSQLGRLSHFVGMVTDSRSFLSFPRHEYFRRILCNLTGTDIDRGELPRSQEWVDIMIRNICYENAMEYFHLKS